MPYIGNPIYQSAFVTDQFSGTDSQTAYTMSVAPAGVSNVLVIVSGVVQDPSTYGVVGNTLTFSTAPPSGTGNISCRYLGVPATGVVTTAYRTLTEFTATAGQTTFTPPSYNVGFINVLRNGVQLGTADFTATNGITVVLATGATAGDLITIESFLISSVANAIANAAGSVSSLNIQSGVTLTAPNLGTPASGVMTNVTNLPAAQLVGSQAIPKSTLPTGAVLQVVNVVFPSYISTTSGTFSDTGMQGVITPTSATSKILIFLDINGIAANASGAACMKTQILRNGSFLTHVEGIAGYANGVSSERDIGSSSTNYLDSPATTSTLTYKVQYANASGSGTVYMNNYYTASGDSISTMTLMEIAG